MTISFLLEKTYRLETSFERPEKKKNITTHPEKKISKINCSALSSHFPAMVTKL